MKPEPLPHCVVIYPISEMQGLSSVGESDDQEIKKETVWGGVQCYDPNADT